MQNRLPTKEYVGFLLFISFVVIFHHYKVKGTVFLGNTQSCGVNYFLLKNIMYLLTEWEGQTGKYLVRGQDIHYLKL